MHFQEEKKIVLQIMISKPKSELLTEIVFPLENQKVPPSDEKKHETTTRPATTIISSCQTTKTFSSFNHSGYHPTLPSSILDSHVPPLRHNNNSRSMALRSRQNKHHDPIFHKQQLRHEISFFETFYALFRTSRK